MGNLQKWCTQQTKWKHEILQQVEEPWAKKQKNNNGSSAKTKIIIKIKPSSDGNQRKEKQGGRTKKIKRAGGQVQQTVMKLE